MDIAVLYMTRCFGICGMVTLLYSYFALQKGLLTEDNYRYLNLNALGSLLMLATTIVEWNLAGFLINAAWLCITLHSIHRLKAMTDQTPHHDAHSL